MRFIFIWKKVGVAHQKMGIVPQKCLWNTNLLIKITKKTFFTPDSIKVRHLESHNHFLLILSAVTMKKIMFFCVLEVFWGSKPIYLMGDTHFFSSENIFQSIYHTPWRKKWTFQVKKWGFDPKMCFQESPSVSYVFLGSNAHFLTS